MTNKNKSVHVLDDGWLLASCSYCGRTIRYRKNDVTKVQYGLRGGIACVLYCPGCKKENYDLEGKPEQSISPPIIAAAERVAKVRAGARCSDVYGTQNHCREAFIDDMKLIADYFIQSIGLSA